jgi:type I restriction-modification system DNA methylase subunit
MRQGNLCHRKQFIKTFNAIANHRHRYEVFRDFVTMAAISLHNAVNKVDALEQEYLQIVGRYERKEVSNFCELLAHVIEMLEPEPRDVLGGLYMELELGNDNTGQFFTPPDVSLMMAQMTYGYQLKNMEYPYITLSEPASGAGGMVLAFAKVMMSHGHNPAHKLWVQCIDVDRLAALMCYIQLTLWHIPAEVVVGNTLSMEIREVFYTPAHYLGGWTQRLKFRELSELMNQSPKADKPETEPKKEQIAPKGDGFQFDFGF